MPQLIFLAMTHGWTDARAPLGRCIKGDFWVTGFAHVQLYESMP